MSRLTRARKGAVAAAVLAALLALSIVSPAMGGPSLRSVAKNAKKALSTAKKANNRAYAAIDDAADARAVAIDAKNTAVAASARGTITQVTSAKTFIGPGGVGSATAYCPAGQRAISGGGAMISGVYDGLAVSGSNSGRSGWFVVAGNNASITAV
jgi:hypothetical protein